eukprot:gene5071-4961_t
MTHLCDKVLRAEGPALLFDAPDGYKHRVLGNLFGTPKRVAMGMGASNTEALRDIGRTLAYLKEPEPPKGMRDALDKLPLVKQNRLIMRWLAHRGGALDFRDHALKYPGQPFPISVALGADPATILGAVTPVPDTLSEYQFAGLLRGSRTEL